MRYSYVEPDGEAYDNSDVVEEGLRDNGSAGRNGLVLGRKDAVGEKLNRVLSQIKQRGSGLHARVWMVLGGLPVFRSTPWTRLLRIGLSSCARSPQLVVHPCSHHGSLVTKCPDWEQRLRLVDQLLPLLTATAIISPRHIRLVWV